MSFRTISALVRGQWLIEPSYVQAHLPLIHGVITGSSNGAELFKGSAQMEMPFAFANGKRIDAYVRNEWGEYIFREEAFPEGSIAVIPVIGPVMKYNGDCGEPGMVKRSSWVGDFASSSKTAGFIFYIDSPGGQADGTPQFADLIKSLKQPTIAFVDGGAYSAGMWIASACDQIVLSHEFTGVGSIGAYTTIVDYRGYFEKQGFKVTEIYPDESSEKNIAYRKAIDGDISLMKEDIAELAIFFRKCVAENRGSRLTSDVWNKGATYNAAEGIKIGLADHIGTFEFAASLITGANVAPKKEASQNANPQNTTDMNLVFVAALAGKESPSVEAIELANGELKTNNVNSVILVESSFLDEAANVTTENTRLTGELATANTAAETAQASLATAKTDLETANTSLAAAKTEIEELNTRLAALPGATHTKKVGEDPAPAGEEEDAETIINNLPHNRNADRVIG